MEEQKKFCDDFMNCNWNYFETCATYGFNVEQTFSELTRLVLMTRSFKQFNNSGAASYHGNLIRKSSVSDNNIKIYNTPSLNGDNNFMSSPVHNNHILTSSTPLSNIFTPNNHRKSLRSKRMNFMHRKNSDLDDKKSKSFIMTSSSVNNSPSFKELGTGRNIPVKQGYLLKLRSSNKNKLHQMGNHRNRAEWKKKFVALDRNGLLCYYNNMNDYMENRHKQSIHVQQTTIKLPGRLSSLIITNNNNDLNTDHTNSQESCENESGGSCEFQIITISGCVWHFQAANIKERDDWVQQIEKIKYLQLKNNKTSKSYYNATFNSNGKDSSFNISTNDVINSSLYEVSLATNDDDVMEMSRHQSCVECGGENPTWTSLNLGCLICIQCSGIHRKLGTHISRVRSLELDDWPAEYLGLIKRIGNSISRKIWGEYNCDVTITLKSSKEEREQFIRDKYENRKYLAPLPPKYCQGDICQHIIKSIKESDACSFLHLLAHAKTEDINKKHGFDENTALHVASSIGDLSFCQLLLWMNSSTSILNSNGETPHDVAMSNHHFECARILQHTSQSHQRRDRGHSDNVTTPMTSPGVDNQATPNSRNGRPRSRSSLAISNGCEPKLIPRRNLMYQSAI